MGLWLMAIHLFKAPKREFEPKSLNLNQNNSPSLFFHLPSGPAVRYKLRVLPMWIKLTEVAPTKTSGRKGTDTARKAERRTSRQTFDVT